MSDIGASDLDLLFTAKRQSVAMLWSLVRFLEGAMTRARTMPPLPKNLLDDLRDGGITLCTTPEGTLSALEWRHEHLRPLSPIATDVLLHILDLLVSHAEWDKMLPPMAIVYLDALWDSFLYSYIRAIADIDQDVSSRILGNLEKPVTPEGEPAPLVSEAVTAMIDQRRNLPRVLEKVWSFQFTHPRKVAMTLTKLHLLRNTVVHAGGAVRRKDMVEGIAVVLGVMRQLNRAVHCYYGRHSGLA